MLTRPQVIAANKVDVIYPDGEDPIQRLKDEFEPQGVKVFPISAVTGKGVKELLYHVKSLLDSIEKKQIIFEQEYFPEDELICGESAVYCRKTRRWSYVCGRRTKD